MCEPIFSRVFEVTINLYGYNNDVEVETIFVLAEDIEDAVEQGKDYADTLNYEDLLIYEVVSAEICCDIFVGIHEEEDTEEVTLTPHSEEHSI